MHIRADKRNQLRLRTEMNREEIQQIIDHGEDEGELT